MRKYLSKHWRYHEYVVGSGILWDDNNIHYVQNLLPGPRVILIGDVPRRDLPNWLSLINDFLLNNLAKMLPGVKEYFKAIEDHQERAESGETVKDKRTTMEVLLGEEFVDNGGFQ